ncbi:2-oxo acid dehydrogenase subunit E2 [Mycolicibacterium sphagni]|uniref:2-oxo acid dehydrogenase subunit E2 n=1 Tax=Mycolicibacterium sphagni TaxID=1786 RepID=UPI0021F330BB|nr:2-oxo acid dehydrogenase subunit E2 [Mycolicibacterium sphagni]MCV7177066.1 2-oxo acid dehydrogenase subunit E2 [Mycolicibacterium sphagni]
MTSTADGVETIVTMPALGESVEEGVISRWLCSVGDPIERDEPLLEVATDKVDTEIPAPTAGILSQILADVDAVVAVGEPLAVITSVDATPPQRLLPAEEITPPPAEVAPPPPAEISGLSPPPADGSGAVTEKLSGVRRTIARRMMESLHGMAQLTTVVEADVTGIARVRATHKAEFRATTGHGLSFLPFFVKAAVEALPAHRMLNASVDADVTAVTYHDRCHLGIAVDSPRGLMVPVIRDADGLGVGELAVAIAVLADKVRAGAAVVEDLTGATFTITNTGSRGALFDTPIINHPQTAILGTGAVTERVVALRDAEGGLRIEPRLIAHLSLSYDHRVVDGADAARYLGAVKARLESRWESHELEG